MKFGRNGYSFEQIKKLYMRHSCAAVKAPSAHCTLVLWTFVAPTDVCGAATAYYDYGCAPDSRQRAHSHSVAYHQTSNLKQQSQVSEVTAINNRQPILLVRKY